MKKIISICILASIVAMGSVTFASSPPAPKAEKKDTKQMATQAKESTYKGIVKKHEDGTVLITKEKSYPMTGGDFGMIIGKEVNVVGKVVEDGGVEKIVVSKLQIEKK